MWMIYPLVKLPSYCFLCNWQYLLVTLVIQWVKLKIRGKWLVLSGLSAKQLLFPSVILIKIQLKTFTASNLTQMFSSLWWSWKISCYIYLHYEIVLLMIWVQYRSLNLRPSLRSISGKVFWCLELPHKSCILSSSGNRTINIFCYFVKSIYLQNSLCFYNKHSLEYTTPQKIEKIIKRPGTLFGVIRMNFARLQFFYTSLTPEKFLTDDICYKYVVKSTTWICKKGRSSETLVSRDFWHGSRRTLFQHYDYHLLPHAYHIILIRRICMKF